MKNTTWMAIGSLLLVSGVACNQSKPAGPESAIDRAYHAGILSKGEYEAKLAALQAPAAVLAPAPAPAAPAVAPVAPVVAPPAPAPVAAAPVQPPAAPVERAAAPVQPATPAARANRPPAPKAAAPAAVPERPAPEVAAPVQPVQRHQAAVAEVRPPENACGETEFRPGKEKGKQERFFPAPMATVKAATVKALEELEFNVHKSTDSEIEASKKRHIGVLVGSGGEKMTLRFEEANEGRQRGTLVIGETRKSFVMRAGQKSWTNAVLDQTACMLHTASHASAAQAEFY